MSPPLHRLCFANSDESQPWATDHTFSFAKKLSYVRLMVGLGCRAEPTDMKVITGARSTTSMLKVVITPPREKTTRWTSDFRQTMDFQPINTFESLVSKLQVCFAFCLTRLSTLPRHFWPPRHHLLSSRTIFSDRRTRFRWPSLQRASRHASFEPANMLDSRGRVGAASVIN